MNCENHSDGHHIQRSEIHAVGTCVKEHDSVSISISIVILILILILIVIIIIIIIIIIIKYKPGRQAMKSSELSVRTLRSRFGVAISRLWNGQIALRLTPTYSLKIIQH